MVKVFILVMLSTLILLTGCNSSNTSSETAPPQFVFQQSDTPLELAITPSVIMLGQSANITIKTTPKAFVQIRIVSPSQELRLEKLNFIQSSQTADDEGIFTYQYSLRGALMLKGDQSIPVPGYYRVIAAAESRLENRPEFPHSGNVTIVITSFLVR